ncbi:uncharacterized protein LOC121872870 isoform X1 [Homarus americanus]|uniref:uncharacterized protein LOC121872870 isoform X1 n=1 Tax=Homarus americanus TaxID=6706 RepID=UPI001C49680C|nr:uncharacterized protein LOC121872870 isoform X1 [Homarus americanus]
MIVSVATDAVQNGRATQFNPVLAQVEALNSLSNVLTRVEGDVYTMAWRAPLDLQAWAARAAVVPLVAHTENRIRLNLDIVPAEVLIARATAGLLLHDDDDTDEEDASEVWRRQEGRRQGASYQEVDIMDYALLEVKATLSSVRAWWGTVPGLQAGPGHRLRAALDTHTEVHPRHDQDYPRHLTGLLLKLVLLDNVFIDRDYGDKDRRCVVPFAWERWVAQLISRLGPFPHLQELKVYGGMYPSILASILWGAPHLTSLFISHINITDNIIMAVSRSCPMLEKLYLLHSFPWQVISMKAFCAAFFEGASKRELLKAIRTGQTSNISVTFTSLKEIELAYGEIEVAKEFHKLLLTYYPNLSKVSSDWKTNLFEDGYSGHGYDVLLPVVSKGNHLSLLSVFLDGETVYSLDLERLHQLAWCCPLVKALTLDCAVHGTPRVCEAAGRQLAELTGEWSHLSELHVNLSIEDHLTHAILMPTLRAHGYLLRSLTIEANSPSQRLHAATLYLFLQLCPNLTKLGLRVWNRYMFEAPLETEENIEMPKCGSLEEISLHEDGPGDNDEPPAEAGHLARWLALLQALIAATPKLFTLSVSVCHGLALLLDKLTCDAQVLHLHVKDGYEWQPTADQVCQLVSRLPHLQHLYLEEVSGRIFWRVWRRCQHTGLTLHWGNLQGWPRT